MKRSGMPKRKKWLKRSTKPLKRSRLKRKRSKHDWPRMTADTWKRSGGRCEWCDTPIPYGSAPAHIIARGRGGCDEQWNLASLCVQCHDKFDLTLGRPRAIAQMREESPKPKLLERIENDSRLKAYSDRIMARYESVKKSFAVRENEG